MEAPGLRAVRMALKPAAEPEGTSSSCVFPEPFLPVTIANGGLSLHDMDLIDLYHHFLAVSRFKEFG